MKRRICFLLSLILLLFQIGTASADGFSQNPDAIEEAARSVLILYVFDENIENILRTGSGFIAFTDQILVTNYHVIDNAPSIFVNDDGENIYYVTSVLCADEDSDIAILELDRRTGLKPLNLFADEHIKRGSPVVAIGSPEAYKNAVSTGIVSQIGTTVSGDVELQFTAPISHGSSGGALFNDDGNVIGVTYAGNEAGQNLNFAIHISVVKAMYRAWDGTRYTLKNHLRSAKKDYTGVYDSKQEVLNTASTSSKDQGTNTITPSETWQCPNCGNINNTQFCLNCGSEKLRWICVCGSECSSKFCGVCGRGYESLIQGLENALIKADELDFQSAINILTALEKFNSGSLTTTRGKNVSAEELAISIRSQWALNEQSKGNYESALSILEGHEDTESKKLRNDINTNWAQSEWNQSHYAEAISILEGRDDSVANNLRTVIYISWALVESENGNYEEAISILGKTDQTQQTQERMKEARYSLGEKLLEEGKYSEAADQFDLAGNYQDAAAEKKKAILLQASQYLTAGEYQRAISLLDTLSDDEEACAIIEEAKYQLALQAEEKGYQEKAINYYEQIPGYKDSHERIEHIRASQAEDNYQQAMTAMDAENYDEAIKLLSKDESYKDSALKIQECYYSIGKKQLDNGNFSDARKSLEKAGGYPGASDLIGASYYEEALKIYERYSSEHNFAFTYINHTTQTSIFQLLRKVSDQEKANELQCRIYYDLAQNNQKLEKDEAAFDYYKKAGEYADAKKKAESLRGSVLSGKMEQSLETAWKFYQSEYPDDPDGEKYIVLEAGKTDEKYVELILGKLSKMGFLRNYKSPETTYKEMFIDGVMKAETALGLTVDGKISLQEAVSINQTIIPGMSNPKCKKLLEIACDLGYINSLDETHDKYENKYLAAVKKMEASVGGNGDGFINPKEYELLTGIVVSAPGIIKNLKRSSNQDNLTISWDKVKDAKFYEIVLDGNSKTIKTQNNQYTFKGIVTGRTYSITVTPCKYSVKGKPAYTFASVETYYKNTSLKDVVSDYSKYAGREVRLTNLKMTYKRMNGNDLHVFCSNSVNGKKYTITLVFQNYNSWQWNGKGIYRYNEVTFNEVKGRFEEQDKKYGYHILYVDSITWTGK